LFLKRVPGWLNSSCKDKWKFFVNITMCMINPKVINALFCQVWFRSRYINIRGMLIWHQNCSRAQVLLEILAQSCSIFSVNEIKTWNSRGSAFHAPNIFVVGIFLAYLEACWTHSCLIHFNHGPLGEYKEIFNHYLPVICIRVLKNRVKVTYILSCFHYCSYSSLFLITENPSFEGYIKTS
jgi:hypothetical protein